MANRLFCGCCGCPEFTYQLWPDFYDNPTAICFVKKRTVTTTQTVVRSLSVVEGEVVVGAITSDTTETTDVTEETTDTRSSAGRWTWVYPQTSSSVDTGAPGEGPVIEGPAGEGGGTPAYERTTTIIDKTVYEERRLAILLDTSNQYHFGVLDSNSDPIIYSSHLRLAITDPLTPTNATPITNTLVATIRGTVADTALPTDRAGFDTLYAAADDIGLVEHLPGPNDGKVRIEIANQEVGTDHLPSADAATILFLLGPVIDDDHGILITETKLSIADRYIGPSLIDETDSPEQTRTFESRTTVTTTEWEFRYFYNIAQSYPLDENAPQLFFPPEGWQPPSQPNEPGSTTETSSNVFQSTTGAVGTENNISSLPFSPFPETQTLPDLILTEISEGGWEYYRRYSVTKSKFTLSVTADQTSVFNSEIVFSHDVLTDYANAVASDENESVTISLRSAAPVAVTGIAQGIGLSTTLAEHTTRRDSQADAVTLGVGGEENFLPWIDGASNSNFVLYLESSTGGGAKVFPQVKVSRGGLLNARNGNSNVDQVFDWRTIIDRTAMNIMVSKTSRSEVFWFVEWDFDESRTESISVSTYGATTQALATSDTFHTRLRAEWDSLIGLSNCDFYRSNVAILTGDAALPHSLRIADIAWAAFESGQLAGDILLSSLAPVSGNKPKLYYARSEVRLFANLEDISPTHTIAAGLLFSVSDALVVVSSSDEATFDYYDAIGGTLDGFVQRADIPFALAYFAMIADSRSTWVRWNTLKRNAGSNVTGKPAISGDRCVGAASIGFTNAITTADATYEPALASAATEAGFTIGATLIVNNSDSGPVGPLVQGRKYGSFSSPASTGFPHISAGFNLTIGTPVFNNLRRTVSIPLDFFASVSERTSGGGFGYSDFVGTSITYEADLTGPDQNSVAGTSVTLSFPNLGEDMTITTGNFVLS